MQKNVLIIGAGKIGRGFIAHLFYRSGYRIFFLDTSKEMVSLLKREKKYRIDIAHETNDITEYVEVEDAFTLEEKETVASLLNDVNIIASSVGAANIEKVAGYFKEVLVTGNKKKLLNWLICENATHPAKTIRTVLLQDADTTFQEFVQCKLGLIETQILRTGMPANEQVTVTEPLALRMQNWWTLPMDKDAFVGAIPVVEGFAPQENFSHELIRKIYTNNGTNAAIAYIGWANGYHILHESALAYQSFFREIQEESAFGLISEYGFDEKEHRQFMEQAMKKYRDPALNDRIERNAHDSKRKLAKDERLTGPALLCLKHGRRPVAFAIAIAAAYHYKGSHDDGTLEVQQTIQENGIEEAIKRYSTIDETCELFGLIVVSYKLKSFIF